MLPCCGLAAAKEWSRHAARSAVALCTNGRMVVGIGAKAKHAKEIPLSRAGTRRSDARRR